MTMASHAYVVMKQLLDKSTTPPMKRKLLGMRDRTLDLLLRSKVIAGQLGPLPDFIIIGAQKCGTTFLYDELAKHACIAPAITKEIHFFDFKFNRGVDWYRACFAQPRGQARGQARITGEASPYYIFHPLVARRIANVAPQAKLIALLRNPVNRAYSHYQHEVRLGFERLPFDQALDREQARLRGEAERMQADPSYQSFTHAHYGYLTRGIYIDQLKRWRDLFPDRQLLILRSEDLYGNTPETMGRVLDFLGLPDWGTREYRKKASAYPKMDAAIRSRLMRFFEPHNRRLADELGTNFTWDS
jgi:hypothetical protein